MKKFLSILLALTMVLSLGVPAFAGTAPEDQYPVRFDLRDYGVVTPVKMQSPWGSCWAFGGIAAAESSILSTLGMTNEEFKEKTGQDFDLSEKHLLWYGTRPVTELTTDSQAGEGIYVAGAEEYPAAIYNDGGTSILTTTLFASGVGPVMEASFPYQGAEGVTDIQFYQNHPEVTGVIARSMIEPVLGMTLEEAVALAHENPEKAGELFGLLYAYGFLDESIPAEELTIEMVEEANTAMYMMVIESSTGDYYSSADDWTIPDVDDNGRSNRDIYAGFTLVDGNILPSLRILDDEGHWTAVNDAGMLAVKSELLQGRGVSAAFKSDKALPGESVSANGFMNIETWAHYTYEDIPQSHAICIIGWDDGYSKDNFNPDHRPPADGAWLVKNSWGSETDYVTLPDGTVIGRDAWGLEDADGRHTGYFWISYYDKTLDFAESMVFDTDLVTESGSMGVWMYDYMPSYCIDGIKENGELKIQSESMIKTANVFCNNTGSDVRLYGISTKTASPRARVVYSVYKLNADAANPEDGEFLGRKIAYYEYAGFHRQQLSGDITIKDGESIAVIVEESVVNADGEKLYEYAVNSAPSKSYAEATEGSKYGVAVVNKGESFLYEDGQWKDWSGELADAQAYAAEQDVNLGDIMSVDNFSIKAYVVKDAA